jgi:hypothetical protein
LALTEAYEQSESATLFPNYNGNELWQRVRTYWDIDNYSVPLPKQVLTCPQCSSDKLQVRSIPWHSTNSKTIPYRADFNLKCTNCALRYGHGIIIPQEMYKDLEDNAFGSRWIEQLALMHKREEILEKELTDSLHERIHEIWNE